MSVYALCILQFSDITIMPLARAWPAGLVARILRGAEESVCFSFRCLAFISGLTNHCNIRCVRLDQSTAMSVVHRCHAASDTACTSVCTTSRYAVDFKCL